MLTVFNTFSQNRIVIEPKPGKIFIEQSRDKQIINFDFLVSNKSTDTLILERLSISVFDSQQNLLQSRFLDNNGTAPSIRVLPKRSWNGDMSLLIFNPFSEFEIETSIHSLEYEWTFSNDAEEEFIVNSTVYPEIYTSKNKLDFPLDGKVLVYDAHDYNSHHRRFDYNFEPIKALGIKSNFMRYAYDFVVLNDDNRQFNKKGNLNEDYYGFGSPVYAVQAGKVIYVSNNHKDDKSFDISKVKDNPLELYGNCIAIQHSNNSISIYGHLKENSIKVTLDERVSTNQQLAQIGASGSSFFPHLHFEIRTSISDTAEGLPSYFKNIHLLEGSHKRRLKTGLVETGTIVEVKK